MATKRPRQPKDHQCLQCLRWYTAKNIGTHTQNCAKWDIPDEDTLSLQLSQLGELQDDDTIMEDILLSSQSTLSQTHSDPGDPPEHPSPTAFADFGPNDDEIFIRDNEEANRYQNERIYDSEGDEDWWNEFCIPEIEPLVEVDEEEAEEFEELLNWIDNEFDLEVAQNCE
jgi:hypothetical protein